MALSYNEVVAGTGQTLVTVTFPFLDRAHVKVSVDREDLPGSAWTWVSDASIQLAEPMVGGETLRVYRETPSAGVQADFQPGAFDYQELNTSLSHLLYIVQEAYDNAISAVEAGHSAFAYLVQIEELAEEIALIFADVQAIQTALTGHSAETIAAITALVASASALSAETLGYRDATLGYRNQAQVDAGVATDKAVLAVEAASEAATTKGEVESLKIAVEGLEGAAATSAITATNAMSAVQTLYDNFMSAYENFNDRYLGPHDAPPTTDNDGEPLVGGALYFDTSGPSGTMKVWDGTEWRAAYVSFEGTPLIATANLGDLTNVPQARINLGLGSVDNTPDLSKPVSTPQQSALDLKAPLANPAFTGNATAPTKSPGDDTTSIATTAFVQAAIAALSDYWALQPIGVPIPLADNIAGVSAPATDKAYRYIKLTASDAYNTGVLTGQSVSGSSPNITATAIVSLVGSPLHGQTVALINTDRRFLRAGSAGTKEASQNLSHTHTGTANSAGAHSHTVPQGGGAAGVYALYPGLSVVGSSSTSSDGAHTHTLTINADGGTEARPANLGVTYYMRIK